MTAARRNDVTIREDIWRRFEGDDWSAFDALPPRIRSRLAEHAYDPWAVNALILWKSFRRKHASTARGEVTMLRYLDQLETMERAAFSARYSQAYGTALPHDAACASILRYDGCRDYERECRAASPESGPRVKQFGGTATKTPVRKAAGR